MQKTRKKQLALKNPSSIALLLGKFLLIKLGTIFRYFLVFLIRAIQIGFKPFAWFFRPPHKKRGRPKKSGVLYYFKLPFRKLISFLTNRLPKPILVLGSVSLIILIIFTYTLITFKAAYQLPNPDRLMSPDKPMTTEFFDRNGKLLFRLYEGQNRVLTKIEDLPPHLIQATIAIEDKHFYNHLGIDIIAIIRAAYHNITEGKLEGASTITQQLIKNTILTPEKTFTRKIKEVILAFWTERILTKDQILQAYLNEASFGGPHTGIAAASMAYFNKAPKDLTLAESSFLAGLPASPTQFSPYGVQPELGKLRQKEVLRRMREEGFISAEQEQWAYEEPLNINPPITNIYAPHFVMYIKDQLARKYGPRVVTQGGLKIYTTLDLTIQQQAEKIVAEEIDKLAALKVQNGAALITDPKTGQILAMVGSRDYFYPGFGNFNVTTANRQPGSSIKPITYAAAFNKGFTPGNTVLDTPITFRDNWGNSYSPVNYDGRFHGPVSIRTALGSSYNIPAVKILDRVGVENMIQTARELGITTFSDPRRYGLSITLGAAEVKMTDMAIVYGTFSQMGIKRPLTGILKVSDSSGNLLEEFENQPIQAIKPEVAYLITNILADNKARTPAFGPNSLLKIEGFDVAVKTGTTEFKKDNWTIGYSPDYVVVTWVGNPDNTPMDQKLASGITGAAPIWNKIMTSLLAGHLPTAFRRPSGIIEVRIDGRRDLAIADFWQNRLGIINPQNNQIILTPQPSSLNTTISSDKN